MLDEIINYVQSLQNQVEVIIQNINILFFSRVLLDSIEVLTIFSTVPFDEDCFCESHALWFWSGHGCIHGQTRSTKPG